MTDGISTKASRVSKEEIYLLYALYADGQSQIKSKATLSSVLFLAQNGGLREDPIPESDTLFYTFQARRHVIPLSSGLESATKQLESESLIKITKPHPGPNARNDYSIIPAGVDVLESHGVPPACKHIKASKILYNDTPILKLVNNVRKQYPEYVDFEGSLFRLF